MHLTPKVRLLLFSFVLAGFFVAQHCFATTYIVGPEDNSVYIDQRDPDINFVSKTGILVASELNENARTVIHFDLGGWSADSISGAKLCLYRYRGGNYSVSRTINVCPLTTSFDESTATWNYPWVTPGGDFDSSVSASASVPELPDDSLALVQWDVTEIFQVRWDNVVNCGFLVKDPVEDAPPPDGPYARFHSHRKDSFLPYLEISTEPTDVEQVDDENTHKIFSLGQNFPNPFNNKTLVEFELSRPAWVDLTVYNIQGRRVKTLVDAKKQAGTHLLEWDATDERGKPVSSGVYLYRLQTGDFSQTKRLLYLK
jgi:hypothetical protein